MYAKAEKRNKSKSRSVANSVVQMKSDRKQEFGFVDNRPEMVAQRQLAEISHRINYVRISDNIIPERCVIQAIRVKGDGEDAELINDGKALLEAFTKASLLTEENCPEAYLFAEPNPELEKLCTNVFSDKRDVIISLQDAFSRFKRNAAKAQKQQMDALFEKWKYFIEENPELSQDSFQIETVDSQYVKDLAKIWGHRLSQLKNPTSKQKDAARGVKEIQEKIEKNEGYTSLVAWKRSVPCAIAIAQGGFVDWVVVNPLEVEGVPPQKGGGRVLLKYVALQKNVVSFNPLGARHFEIYEKMGFKRTGGSFTTTKEHLLENSEALDFIKRNIDPESILPELRKELFEGETSAVPEQ